MLLAEQDFTEIARFLSKLPESICADALFKEIEVAETFCPCRQRSVFASLPMIGILSPVQTKNKVSVNRAESRYILYF
jgi:hypothetical protein